MRDKVGTLYSDYDSGFRRTIRSGPLWILLRTALQGHEGSVEEMTIETEDGLAYTAGEIRDLARLVG